MRNSSPAERVIVGLVTILVAIMGFVAVMVIHLNREVGVGIATMTHHLENHPNTAIERDVENLERRLLNHQLGHPTE